MFYKQNALLKDPKSDALTMTSAKGVAKFIDDGDKRLEISLANVTINDLTLKYSAKDFSISFKLTDKTERFNLPAAAPYGGGVLIIDENTATPVLYGAFSADAPNAKEMTDNSFSERYDDELIAEENYYEYENATAMESDNRTIHRLSESTVDFKASGGENLYAADLNDASAKSDDSEDLRPYYKRVEKELKKLFDENQKEKDLERIVGGSKWVRVNYGEGKHYAVGIIYDGSSPLWICYGVPGSFGKRPQEIKNYCSFIPLSVFETKKSGYWVSYQSALSGEALEI